MCRWFGNDSFGGRNTAGVFDRPHGVEVDADGLIAIADEDMERLRDAFTELSDDHRQVITLARVVGMSHAEIADEMGRSEGAVRVLLHRALVRLGWLLSAERGPTTGS